MSRYELMKRTTHYECTNPKRGRDRLARYLTGQMKAHEVMETVIHIAGCHACEEELALIREFFAHVRKGSEKKSRERPEKQSRIEADYKNRAAS